jgi:hypothetical protein
LITYLNHTIYRFTMKKLTGSGNSGMIIAVISAEV